MKVTPGPMTESTRELSDTRDGMFPEQRAINIRNWPRAESPKEAGMLRPSEPLRVCNVKRGWKSS